MDANELLNKEVKKRNEKVNRRLTQLMKEDETFQLRFKMIYDYYYAKLLKVVGNKMKHEEYTNQYFAHISDLFYQGYYLGLEMLDHDEVQFSDRFFQQPNGIMQEQIYDLLEGATGDLVKVVSEEQYNLLERMVLQEDEFSGVLLNQIKKDITCLGTLQALVDHREKVGILIAPELDNPYKGLLYRSDDLFFVDPQKHLICVMTNGRSEKWDLTLWSTLKTRNNKVGEVHVTVFESTETNEAINHLPYYQGFEAFKRSEKTVFVTLIVNEKVTEKERLPIVSMLIESLKARLNVPYESISITLAATEEFTSYQHSSETEGPNMNLPLLEE